MLTLGSLFDGIGGWLDAGIRAGIRPIWASEIDGFCQSVTAHHYPDVVQLGDITKINIDDLAPVDIICAGSPCQDLSVAGKRKGLEGERSGLFREAIDIVHRLRNRDGLPRLFVWENVCGAFRTNKGMDFKTVLEEIGQTEIPMPEGGWANSGVAELPKCQIAWSVLDSQHFGIPQRRRRIFLVADFATSGRCATEILFKSESLLGSSEEGREKGKDTSQGIKTGTNCTGWDAYQHHNWRESDKLGPLTTGTGHVRGDTPLVAYSIDTYSISHDIRSTSLIKEKADPLTATDYKDPIKVNQGSAVRRLTPTECERLQGWPDGYTDIPYKGKPASDTARYKALGNGMAQPCPRWLMRRISEEVENEHKRKSQNEA